MDPAEKRVLARISPPAELPPIVTDVLARIDKAVSAFGAAAALGGSTAKRTYLAGDHDIDIFVRFDPGRNASDEISGRLREALESEFDEVEVIHGSRDYFSLDLGDFEFEVIPVLRIGSWEQAQNVTDMSPLHVEYVQKHVAGNPDLADHIRLLKQFCKAARVYGAESYIGGFSGYMVELLVLNYGSFRGVLEAASDWAEKEVIDPENHHEAPLKTLDKSKTRSPLVLVDPVQRDRNAAAALTRETYDRFREQSRLYLRAEDKEGFFEVGRLDPSRFCERFAHARVFRIDLHPSEGKHDVLGAKCLKAFEYIVREVELCGFAVIERAWEFDGDAALCLLAVEDEVLPETRVLIGPPLEMEEHAAQFREEHADVYEEEGRLYAREPRQYREPLPLLKDLCESAYVLDRVVRASVDVVRKE